MLSREILGGAEHILGGAPVACRYTEGSLQTRCIEPGNKAPSREPSEVGIAVPPRSNTHRRAAAGPLPIVVHSSDREVRSSQGSSHAHRTLPMRGGRREAGDSEAATFNSQPFVSGVIPSLSGYTAKESCAIEMEGGVYTVHRHADCVSRRCTAGCWQQTRRIRAGVADAGLGARDA